MGLLATTLLTVAAVTPAVGCADVVASPAPVAGTPRARA